jgi:argininosuccinate lyase
MEKLWAGRFKEKTGKAVESFTSSLSFDTRLWKYDIEGSIAHVRMLGKQKIIPKKDAELIIKGLDEIKSEIQAGKFRFLDSLEDVHMNIEHALIKKIGPAGGKIHTARSRNDQVTLDLRLFLRDEISEILKLIRDFQRVIVAAAEKNIDMVMPGYTHLQRAQPVLLSHHLLAYFEMLERDRERFEGCLKRVNVLPLGSAALAGTTLPVDRKYVARVLKFPAISANSIDTVSDRDFVVEFISTSSILMIHLSRLSEEIIIWNSDEFGFVELPDAFTTGSSIMPQKKNPDVLELTRGKTGRVYGHLMSILTVMKALPLSYNRDMQEDKEPVFDTVDTLKSCLYVLTKLLPEVRFKKKNMEKAAVSGFLTATDLAEYLVRKGIPFREAHTMTGKIVKYCIEKGKVLTDLNLKDLKRFSKLFDQDVFHYIALETSVEGKDSFGGTSKKMVRVRIKKIKSSLLIISCFLFLISQTACGRRGDPVLVPSYDEKVMEEDIDDNKKGEEESGGTLIKEEETEAIETEAARPDAPTKLVAVYTGKGIVITWNEVPGQGVKSYKVYRSSGEEYALVGDTVTPAFTDRDIRQDIKYYYKVTAVGKSEGPPSKEITVITE